MRWLAPAVLLLVVAACGDDKVTGLHQSPTVTLDELWPNDDGHEWVYFGTGQIWTDSGPVTLYASSDAVPPLPPLTELAERLATPG